MGAGCFMINAALDDAIGASVWLAIPISQYLPTLDVMRWRHEKKVGEFDLAACGFRNLDTVMRANTRR
jgi:hypothetical protein